MTVSATTVRKDYAGNGVAVAFSVPFRVIDADDLSVVLIEDATGIESPQTLTVNYTVAITETDATVTMLTAPAAGYTLRLDSAVPFTQPDTLRTQGRFDPRTVERMFDRSTAQILQLDRDKVGEADVVGIVEDYAALPADASVRTDLAASTPGKGGWMVKYISAGVGAVARWITDKLRDFETVEDYGAVGDGVTNDSAAFTRMLVATNGRVRTLRKEYNVGTWSVAGYTSVVLEGAGKPRPNSALSKLQGGTVLVGRVNIVGNDVEVRDLGVDCGSARAAVVGAIVEGFVIDAVAGQTGVRAVAQNIAVMGAGPANGHALLIEGFDRNDVDNIYVGQHLYGVVVKGRNALVRNIDADKIDQAAVFIKSDLPAYAGNVLNATVQNAQVTNVRHRAEAANVAASGVYIHASTASLAGCQVSNVYQTYGHSALRVQGDASNVVVASGIVANNIVSDSAQKGVSVAGYCYDVMITDIKATNPVTGSAIDVAAQVSNWQAKGIQVLISDVANVSTVCANFAGTGLWDNFTVRNPYRTMVITGTVSQHDSVITGKRYGPVTISGEVNLAFANGSAAGPIGAVVTPRVALRPGSVVQCAGIIDVQAVAGTGTDIGSFAPGLVVPAGKGPRYFACAAKKDDGTYVTVPVKVSGFLLTLMIDAAGYTWVDIGNISFKFE